MRNPFHNGIPLFIYIAALVTISIILVAFLNVLNVRHESSKVALRMANQSFSLITQGVTSRVQADVAPVLSMVNIASALSTEETSHDWKDAQSALLLAFTQILRSHTSILAVNHGYYDGSFYSLTALRTPEVSKRFGAPDGAVYAAWSVGIPPTPPATALWNYYDADMNLLASRTSPSDYDPRTKPWYKNALTSNKLIMTEPYIFTTSQGLGVACSRTFPDGKGVFSVNILLSDIGDFLASLPHTEGGMVLLLDQNLRVLAARGNDSLEKLQILMPVSEVADPVIHGASSFVTRDSSSLGTQKKEILGEQYFIHISRMLLGVQPLTLLIVSPVSGFTAFMDDLLLGNLLFTLVVLTIFILLAVLLARSISAPLEELVQEATRVREFDLSGTQQIHTRISEMQRLAQAVEHMKSTIGQRTTALLNIKNSLKATVEERTRDLVAARDTAQQATDAKSTFLACMSHEIRTPLGGILGMTQLCLAAQPSEQQKHYLERIEFSASNLLTIANDVLDFSKIEAGKMDLENVAFSLPFVLDHVHAGARAQAENKGLALNLHIDDVVPPWIFGDALRLTQVINNLLSNAIKFTLRGSVTITVYVQDSEDTNMVCFEIKDTGIGLNPEQRKNIFQPFSQAESSTSRRFGGTGLGLSITTNLVKIMGGRLWVDSEEGKGSAFGFCIPLVPASEEDVKEERDMQNVPKELWNSHLLLVEDDAINQEIAVEMLHSLHMRVDVAENGQEALTRLQNQSPADPYHLVFMDVHMPIMDGIEATRAARKLNMHLPIIALSASATTQDSLTSMEAGMQDHLSKPFIREAMIKALCCWLPVGHADAQSPHA